MPSITFHVDDDERTDLVRRADRDKVNLSDYIRVRLGLRELGSHTDAELGSDPGVAQQLADHERRIQALEAR